MISKLKHILSGLLISILLFGCSGAKLLERDQKFFSGVEFNFSDDLTSSQRDDIVLALEELIQPTPNVKFLGSRTAVWLHQITEEPKKDKGLKHWVKYKIGKRPVLQNDFEAKLMMNRVKNYLRNVGYFWVEVQPEVEERKHEVKYIFNVELGPQYKVRNITYPKTDSIYESLISGISSTSLLSPGQPYNLELLQEEQNRIEDYLENRGFYYFDDKYSIYEADSTVGNHQIDLKLVLSPQTPDRAKRIFTLSEVKIDTDHSITSDTASQTDKDIGDGYHLINDNNYLKPRTLKENILLKPGSIYSEKAEMRTRERLIALGLYKFIDLGLSPSDSALLTTQINLTPLPRKSIRLEAQAVSKSNNFIGPLLSARFQNRNTFRGAELFELRLNGSYEVQVGGQNDPPLNAFELNLEGSLTIPRMISPLNINYNKLRFMPQTRISLGSRIVRRVNIFQINSFELRYGFQWRQSLTKQHSLYPINVSLVQLKETSPEFEERLMNDLNLSRSIEDQYIVGAIYEYTFSTRNGQATSNDRHNYYFNFLADISGNLLRLAEGAFNLERNSDRVPYSQYAKIQTDFRYYRRLGKQRELAARLILGAARAYGNSEDVPFIKQFSAGGSTSIRAFRARSLGPGSFTAVDTTDLVLDETGDIKLEASIEYRTKIAGLLEGALFLDAGNVWLWEDRPDEKPGGAFTSDFASDLAIGTGAGLRLNFDFFVLRFDFAFPLRKPSLPKGNRWVIGDINPLDSDWRSDNLLLNIAIGYPF